jgi:hypothetical protein
MKSRGKPDGFILVNEFLDRISPGLTTRVSEEFLSGRFSSHGKGKDENRIFITFRQGDSSGYHLEMKPFPAFCHVLHRKNSYRNMSYRLFLKYFPCLVIFGNYSYFFRSVEFKNNGIPIFNPAGNIVG